MRQPTEPELRTWLVKAYMDKIVEGFVEKGIFPDEVGQETLENILMSVIEMVDKMVSIEDENGNIQFVAENANFRIIAFQSGKYCRFWQYSNITKLFST